MFTQFVGCHSVPLLNWRWPHWVTYLDTFSRSNALFQLALQYSSLPHALELDWCTVVTVHLSLYHSFQNMLTRVSNLTNYHLLREESVHVTISVHGHFTWVVLGYFGSVCHLSPVMHCLWTTPLPPYPELFQYSIYCNWSRKHYFSSNYTYVHTTPTRSHVLLYTMHFVNS